MYLRLSPEKVDNYSNTTKLNDETDANNLIYDGNNVTGIEIDYIPIQRWVHVVVAVNDVYGPERSAGYPSLVGFTDMEAAETFAILGV